MALKRLLFLFVFLVFCNISFAQAKKYQIHTVAFYNFENLFDTIDGPNNDQEWLPNGAQNWTGKKYKQKLINLSRVLTQIGTNDQQKAMPVLIGGCEIENRNVLEDLVRHPTMILGDYGVVHFDSPDKRGIDVALLYQKKHFKPTSFKNIPLYIFRKDDKKSEFKEKEEITDDKVEYSYDNRVYTRDVLLVTGMLDGEEINILVNHWPSRSGGEKKSSPFREEAGKLNKKIMDSIYKKNPLSKIILMGDLNDGTYNKSVKEAIGAKRTKDEVKKFGVYNPFEQMAREGNNSLFYRDAGDIFDQIMVSQSLLQSDHKGFEYWKSGIYNKPFMIQNEGQYKGYPLRHTAVDIGFSDHFPVYIYLIKQMN